MWLVFGVKSSAMVTFAGAPVVGAAWGLGLGEEHAVRKMANTETAASAGAIVKRVRDFMRAIAPHFFVLRAFTECIPCVREVDLRCENPQSVEHHPIVWGIVRNMICRRSDVK